MSNDSDTSGIAIILLIVRSMMYISRYFIRNFQTAQNKLRDLALYDSLTGIRNRMSGMQMLSNEISRSKRTGAPLSIAPLDLDFFKKVNDTYGLKEFLLIRSSSLYQIPFYICCWHIHR